MFDCFYRMLASNKHFLCFITEDFLSWKKAHNAWINPYSWVYFSRRCDWLKKGWASRGGNGLSFTDRIAEQIVLVITQVWKESKLSIHSNLPKSETGKQGGFKNAAYAARNSELFMICLISFNISGYDAQTKTNVFLPTDTSI